MKERSIGVTISSTEEGGGSSCEITSWARTRGVEPISDSSTNSKVVINNRAKIIAVASARKKDLDLRSGFIRYSLLFLMSE
jgi:hypothetical protein